MCLNAELTFSNARPAVAAPGGTIAARSVTILTGPTRAFEAT